MNAETGEWRCRACRRLNEGPVCGHCGRNHGSADDDCRWEPLPDAEADAILRIEVCTHGLSRFVTA